MPVSRRTYTDLAVRYERLLAERDTLRETCAAQQTARVAVSRQLGEADAANKRLYGRNQELGRLLDTARAAQGEAANEELTTRLDRALRACARYRTQIGELRRPRPTPPAGRFASLLERSERARRSLDEQLATVQAANDSLCRDAADRAQTLALPEAIR